MPEKGITNSRREYLTGVGGVFCISNYSTEIQNRLSVDQNQRNVDQSKETDGDEWEFLFENTNDPIQLSKHDRPGKKVASGITAGNRLTLHFSTPESNDVLGMAYGIQDRRNYYMIYVTGENTISLSLVQDDEMEQLSELAIKKDLDGIQRVSVDWQNNGTHYVTFDSTPVIYEMTAENKSWRLGDVGLFGRGDPECMRLSKNRPKPPTTKWIGKSNEKKSERSNGSGIAMNGKRSLEDKLISARNNHGYVSEIQRRDNTITYVLKDGTSRAIRLTESEGRNFVTDWEGDVYLIPKSKRMRVVAQEDLDLVSRKMRKGGA